MELTIDFSPSTYDAVRRECEKTFAKIVEEFNKAIATFGKLPAITAALWKPVLAWLQDAVAEVGSFLKDLLQGIAAPVMFYYYGYRWIDEIGNPASTTEANVSPEAGNLPLFANYGLWEGDAGNAYRDAVKTQTKAANLIASRSWMVAGALGGLATAGLLFYGSLIKTGIALQVGLAAAAAGTVVTAGVAAPTVPGVVGACLLDLVAAVVAFAAVQAGAAFGLSQLSTEGGLFTGDSWPKGTSNYAG
jgi:hypothetical protein